ncbi:MAG: zinc ribbon domain-containing protein [Bacteroidales bacterium]
MEKTYKNCQSCGMPLKRDEKGGGTNADGSKTKCIVHIVMIMGNSHDPK